MEDKIKEHAWDIVFAIMEFLQLVVLLDILGKIPHSIL